MLFRSLVYKAFLGNQLKQDGVQLKWLAPTDLFMEVGAELAGGDRFPGGGNNKNGVGGRSLFGHLGGDIGESTAWRAGVSHLWTSARSRSYTDTDTLGGTVTNTFSGNARLFALDGVLKWAPNGNAVERNFKLQGEYFRLKQDGTLTYNDSAGSAVFNSVSGPFQADQSGYYVQGVWQFYPRWRVGYRYDALRYGTTGLAVPGYELRLIDEHGQEVTGDGIGELQVKGPTSTPGYWNNRAKSRETFLGPWTRSGDKYRRDADGYYVYCGRTDDMLKVGGIWVSPFEVEAALVNHESEIGRAHV